MGLLFSHSDQLSIIIPANYLDGLVCKILVPNFVSIVFKTNKLCRFSLRLLTHVQVSVRCLFKDDQFSLLVWLLLSLLLLCFHIQKQLILHVLAINPSVLIELHLGISNMHHLIVGQVGIKIITSITGGEKSNPL